MLPFLVLLKPLLVLQAASRVFTIKLIIATLMVMAAANVAVVEQRNWQTCIFKQSAAANAPDAHLWLLVALPFKLIF